MLQLKKFSNKPVSTRRSTRVPPTSRGATFPPPSSRGGILSLRGGERISCVPVASQEEGLSTGKARGTPGSCHHSQSPQDVSVHSRETCFPCTASTFKPRIDSDTVVLGTALWDSPVGKPCGKASRESQYPLIHAKGSLTLLLQIGRKRTCMSPLETSTDSPGETPDVPQNPCQHWRGILRFWHRLHTRS